MPDMREPVGEVLAMFGMSAAVECTAVCESSAEGCMNGQVPVWRGTVTHGRIDLEPSESERRRRYLETLEGRAVEVIVRRRSRKRSLDQNAWLWGRAYPDLARTLGYDEHEHEMLHYACLGECFGTTFDQRFGRELPRVSSSRMTTQEFSLYMEWLVRWAATEWHCVIPLPNETESPGVLFHA